MKKIIFIMLFMFCSGLFADSKVLPIMKKLDDLMEQNTDITAKVTMTQKKATQEGIKVSELIYYRRDKDDSFMILMTAPESDRGNGYLKIGENFWMYRRNTRTFQHINRDESIAGSDANAEDFERKKLVELYKPATDEKGQELIGEEMLGKMPVFKITLLAKVKDVKYAKKVYWVSKDKFLPLKEQSYSLSGTLMNTAYYLKYTIIDGKYVAINNKYIDEFEKGNVTIVEISGINTQKLDESIFTKAYLENLSK